MQPCFTTYQSENDEWYSGRLRSGWRVLLTRTRQETLFLVPIRPQRARCRACRRQDIAGYLPRLVRTTQVNSLCR